MSEANALVRYVPALSPLPFKTHRRFRAGVVMEQLEVRRVLSAAVAAACPELTDDVAPDAPAVELKLGETDDTGLVYTTAFQPGRIAVADGGEYVDDWSDDWTIEDDSDTSEVSVDEDESDDLGDDDDEWIDEDWSDEEWADEEWADDDGSIDDGWTDEDWTDEDWAEAGWDDEDLGEDGVDWPEDWAWTLDRLPTVEETDAAWNGDDLGGLWVPIQTFGGDGEDPLYDDYDAELDDAGDPLDGEEWGCGMPDGEFDDANGNWIDFGAEGGDPKHWMYLYGKIEVSPSDDAVYLSRGNRPNERTLDAEPTAAPASTDEPPTDDQPAAGPGGAPTPVAFASPTADGLLLGKLRASVTDEDPSDLPFMN